MNYELSHTDELIDDYFAAEYSNYNGFEGGFSVGDMADMLVELDRRGINARSLTPPAWFRVADGENHN